MHRPLLYPNVLWEDGPTKHHYLIMPPTSKKLRGIVVWACSCICPCICYACIRSGMVRNRILKFDMWNNYEIYADPYFFSFSSDLLLQSYAPFLTFFRLSHCKPMELCEQNISRTI